jgi:hypothetical protein
MMLAGRFGLIQLQVYKIIIERTLLKQQVPGCRPLMLASSFGNLNHIPDLNDGDNNFKE